MKFLNMKQNKTILSKLSALLLALVLIFSLAACGSTSGQQSQSNPSKEVVSDKGNETQQENKAEPEKAPVKEEQKEDPKQEQKQEKSEEAPKQDEPKEEPVIDEKGSYYSKEDVALYIYTYGCLPDNFITKKEAEKLGWEGGSVEKYAPGKAIGGDKFGNYEGLLPKDAKYFECDIDTNGAKNRGAKRIIFSEGGEAVYYTEDHYEHFEQLY